MQASLDQVEVPLPFRINAWSMGKYYERPQDVGHGKSKVCYGLTEGLVLTLRQQKDQLHPKVHASGRARNGGAPQSADNTADASQLGGLPIVRLRVSGSGRDGSNTDTRG